MTDPYNGQLSLQVENSSIREMEIISGTFNAEYGKVMSGVVNIVTPDGGPTVHGSLSGYVGDYLTSHSETFPNLDKYTKFRTQDVHGSLSGPMGLEGLSFFLTGRYYHDGGYLYGTRVYNVTDRSPFLLKDPQGNTILDEHGNPVYIYTVTGDGAYESMNPYTRRS